MPKLEFLTMGAFIDILKHIPKTVLVSAGSIIPSSQSLEEE